LEKYINCYINQGLKIFACNREKKPVTNLGFYDATTDLNVLKGQFQRTSNPLIGLPTGNMNGIVVIDFDINKPIDISDKNSPIDPRSVEELKEAVEADFGPLPETYMVQTPSGGIHYYYRLKETTKLSSKARFLDRTLPVDIRANGGYVCAPDGVSGYEVYDDVNGLGILDLYHRCTVMPDWIEAYKKPPSEAIEPASGVILPEAERIEIRSALQAIPSDDRDLWVNIGTALKNTGCPSAKPLWVEWSSKSDQYDPNDIERRWKGLKPRGDITLGTIFYIAEKQYGWVSTLKKNESQNVISGKTPAVSDNNVYVVTEDHFDALERSKARIEYHMPDRKPFLKELLNPGGLVGDLIDYINMQSIKPQPILALGAALTAVGCLAGRKVQTKTGLAPNLYTMGVGAQSCGKDFARKVIKRCFKDAGCEMMAANENVASDSAINTALTVEQSTLLLMDEIGHFFKSTNKVRQQASYRVNIVPTLLTLFSSSDQVYYGKTYADKENQIVIDRPCLCLYGTTVPDTLYKGLSPENIRDGLLSRMLIFESENEDPPEQDIDIRRLPPSSLLTQIKVLSKKPINCDPQGNIDHTNCNPLIVEETPAAAGLLKEFKMYISKFRAELREDGRNNELYGRAPMMVMKIALILATGKDIDQPIITETEIEYSIKLIKYLTDNMMYITENYISDNEYEYSLQRILNLIRTSGHITISELFSQTQNMNTRSIADIVEHLKMSKKIVESSIRSKETGRETVVYSPNEKKQIGKN